MLILSPLLLNFIFFIKSKNIWRPITRMQEHIKPVTTDTICICTCITLSHSLLTAPGQPSRNRPHRPIRNCASGPSTQGIVFAASTAATTAADALRSFLVRYALLSALGRAKSVREQWKRSTMDGDARDIWVSAFCVFIYKNVLSQRVPIYCQRPPAPRNMRPRSPRRLLLSQSHTTRIQAMSSFGVPLLQLLSCPWSVCVCVCVCEHRTNASNDSNGE